MVGAEDGAGGQARNGVQVIGRAAAILRVLRDVPKGLSLGQIADRVGLARSTVQRIVAALQEEQMIIMIGNGGFRLGPEVTRLAEAVHFDMVEVCRPFLLGLAKASGETADLSVLRGGKIIFLDQVPGSHRLRTVSAVGEAFPLTTTANGKAALAMLAPEEAKVLATREWARSNVTGDWDQLAGQLDRIRATGLAYDINEHTDGISAVGAAFRATAGEINAISVPVPSSRFNREKPRLEKELLHTIERVRSVLGDL